MASRRVGLAALGTSLLLLGALCGCSSAPTAESVTASLGAVPIPTAPAVDPVPTATIGKPQVLAMGAPTLVVIDSATRGTATATGPDQTITQPAASVATSPARATTAATITLTVKSARGSIPLVASDLICRDETGAVVPLTPVGSASATAAPGAPAVLVVSGTFTSGAAQVTWQPSGHPIALWDFNIELD
ncbi:hypothetical protein ACVXZ4_04435 [Lacisediminihabitans sp. FW035]